MATVKYNGPKNVKRQVGGYVWSKDNNHVVEVTDQKMVKTLLDQPNGEFTLVESSASEVKSNIGKRGKV
jgi:hypothetical protein